MPNSVPACTKRFCECRFGEQVSIGGYASAGFAEVVKMPCAEAQGASLSEIFEDGVNKIFGYFFLKSTLAEEVFVLSVGDKSQLNQYRRDIRSP
jgi:hypothetical protein